MSSLKKEEISAAVTESRAWAIKALSALVAADTTLGNEEAGQVLMADIYQDLSFKPEWKPISIKAIKKLRGFSPVNWPLEGKRNLIGTKGNGLAGRSLIFNGHIDVVSPEPTSLWTTAPFKPRIVNKDNSSWMYGRGAGDMKGGTIAYLWALKALQGLKLTPNAKVILQSVVEEECTGNGTLALLAEGITADGCIIPEPFGQTITSSQVGVLWFEVQVLGKTTHVLSAKGGVNAIEKAYLLIDALRDFEKQINAKELKPKEFAEIENPLNLNVGTISGGDWASTVAGECRVRFRIGLYPHQDLKELKAKLEALIAEAAAKDPWLKDFPPRVHYIGFQAEGCHFPLTSPLGSDLSAAHKEWYGDDPVTLSSTATTDIRFFNLYYKIPATCYGPEAKNIHGVDECVNLDSIEAVARVFVSFIERWCGLKAENS